MGHLVRAIVLVLIGIIEAVLVLGSFGVSATRLLFAAVMVGLHYFPLLILAAALVVIYLAAAVAPIVGVAVYRRSFPIRLGLVLTPAVVFGAARAIAVALHISGDPPPPAPPPTGCRPVAVDPNQRLRRCTPNANGDVFGGDCPPNFQCREPVGRSGPPACVISCTHNCMCPAPATCVNAACRFPGDPVP